MKFAALLGVKDEVELIGACVANLRDIGVDQIVVSDYGSTDGTLDILADEQRAGDLLLEAVDVSTVADYDSWSIRERALAESTGADWVLFLDADEFWIPASGSLRDCGGLLEADVLTVDRFNVALTVHQQTMPVGAWLKSNDELLLYTTMPGDFRGFVEAQPEVPFITLMPGPKVMARPHAIAGVGAGSHDVIGRSADAAIRRPAAPDLLIAHVAFSTAERFWRKLHNIRMELAQNPACYDNDDLAWHWKRWAAMTDDAIDSEFAFQMLDDNALSLLRHRAVVRSAQEVFAERLGVDTDLPPIRPVWRCDKGADTLRPSLAPAPVARACAESDGFALGPTSGHAGVTLLGPMPGDLNPLRHSAMLAKPARLSAESAWRVHMPFAMWLVEVSRPRVVVELGTQHGDSYLAICQAVRAAGMQSVCFAVDSWEGDPHSGAYGPEVLHRLREYHDPLYGDFSQLIQSDFDEAVAHFDDGSIDLLHIDGYHTYEAISHDFMTWLPKTSDRGVVLLHDTNARERDFGVWRFWSEVVKEYPSFEFTHGHGLGVLAVGKERPAELGALLTADEKEASRIRRFFFRLGEAVELEHRHACLDHELAKVEAERQQQSRQLAASGVEQKRLRDEVAENTTKRAHLLEDLARKEAERAQLGNELATLRDEHAQLAATMSQIASSRGWRLLERARGARRRLIS